LTPEALIDAYCAAWSEPDATARTAQLGAVLSDDARYTDPRTDVAGPEALSAHIDTVLSARPGSRVERTTAVDEHHGVARFGWRALDAHGSILIEGIDVVELTANGSIARIVGFFGRLASS